MDLEYATIVIKVYYILHNFLIEGDIGEDEQDKESNFKVL
jgi:hypothetical protein